VGIKVLFYPVPLSTPSVPYPNPFVLRNWDIREGLPQTPLGTDQSFKVLFFGKRPTTPPGTVCGSADLWTNGLSFATWQAGGYGDACAGCQCGIWSELCNTILPNVLNVAGDFDTFGQPFTTTATWENRGGVPGWYCPPVTFLCLGVPTVFGFSLQEDTGSGNWLLVTDGAPVDIATVQCAYPQRWSGQTGQLGLCPPVVGNPFLANLTFSAP
jgi:hypothetical protein